MAIIGIVVVVAASFFFFVPVINPYQLGDDICPHSSLVGPPHVSLSFFFLRYGGVYVVGDGYSVWMNPDC